MVVDGNEVFTTVSIGIAVANAPDDTAEGLLRDADAAMYLAKARGRDRYEIFDEELRTQATERLQTESHLRRALEMGEIEVYYQPELSLDTGEMMGAEALARWHHPVAGLLEAGSFIELAEDSGLILELGEWVLTEACRQAGEWQRERPDHPLTIRVNLSARQIAQPDLVDQVVAALVGRRHRRVVAVPGDHRDRAHVRSGRRTEGAPGPAQPRRRAGHRRLRHRLLVAQLPEAVPGGRVEDRPVLRRRPGRATPTTPPSSPPSSAWAAPSGCAWWPRASRPAASSTSCADWDATGRRASCSPGPAPPRCCGTSGRPTRRGRPEVSRPRAIRVTSAGGADGSADGPGNQPELRLGWAQLDRVPGPHRRGHRVRGRHRHHHLRQRGHRPADRPRPELAGRSVDGRLRPPRRPGRAAAHARALARPSRQRRPRPPTDPGGRRRVDPDDHRRGQRPGPGRRSGRSWPPSGWPMPATRPNSDLRQRLVGEGRLVRIASSFVHLPPGHGRRGRARPPWPSWAAWVGRPGRDHPVRRRRRDDDQHPRVGGPGRGAHARRGSTHADRVGRRPVRVGHPPAPGGEHPLGGRPG